jgi:hypothetical protein
MQKINTPTGEKTVVGVGNIAGELESYLLLIYVESGSS